LLITRYKESPDDIHLGRQVGQYGKFGRHFWTSSSAFLLIWLNLRFWNICQVYHTGVRGSGGIVPHPPHFWGY